MGPTQEKGNEGFSTQNIEDDTMPDGYKVELLFDDKAIEAPEDIQELLESILQDFGEIPDDYLETVEQEIAKEESEPERDEKYFFC